MHQIRKRFTYANVMSTIAVMLSLGGATALAASHLAKNSVGAKQLKANAVTGAKVKNGSLTGADVNASTLGQVPSALNAEHANSAAPAGPAGGDFAGSYPNPTIATKAVGTAKLADGAVTTAKLAAGAVGHEPAKRRRSWAKPRSNRAGECNLYRARLRPRPGFPKHLGSAVSERFDGGFRRFCGGRGRRVQPVLLFP